MADSCRLCQLAFSRPPHYHSSGMPVLTGSSTSSYTPVRAPRGNQLSCKGWAQEAAMRMLMNNLDPDVAERPQDLVVYGGTGRAARNWECYHAIANSLQSLANDETLLVQSGKPVGIFRTHDYAPRVLDMQLQSRWPLVQWPLQVAARPIAEQPDRERIAPGTFGQGFHPVPGRLGLLVYPRRQNHSLKRVRPIPVLEAAAIAAAPAPDCWWPNS